MILAFVRMKAKLVELEARADKALEQRQKLTALVENLRSRVDTLEKRGAVK